MAYASRIINHSKKLKKVSNLLRHENAVLFRWFSNDAAGKRDDLLKIHHCCGSVEAERVFYSSTNSAVSLLGVFRKNFSTTAGKAVNPLVGSLVNRGLSGSLVPSRRGFSSDSGLPPHLEIGMPSLSPTMTEGNIARWLKKEGDKVSPGEVLCEVETDIATVEMKCMEEGYLAKIIKRDGSKEIKVGKVIAIVVEEEKDICKFKDYSPSASDAGAAPLKSSSATPTPAKQDNTLDFLRPLSPHLPIYKPQLTSTLSIANRISGAFLATIVLFFYLLCLKMPLICFTYEKFYQFFFYFYSPKLILISAEITALALSYHLYMGVRHLLMDFTKFLR